MSNSASDLQHMAHALRLAQRGLYTTDPNPRVGCVIAKNDEVLGEGWHVRAGGPHAELHALEVAGNDADGATAFVTLEPCSHQGRTPPCVAALVKACVGRVVAAMEDPSPQISGSGFAALAQAGIPTEVGLLQAQAEALNPGFISRVRRGRPFVRAKLAASLDGRTAMPNGESQWITSEAARADVQHWRARSSAILCGVETVLADDPRFTVRALDIGRQPLRVVVDSTLRTPPSAKLLEGDAPTLIVTAARESSQLGNVCRAGAEILCLPADDGAVDLHALLRHLASREVNEVLVESGAMLTGAMLQADLIDELVLYFAPTLMGSEAKPMFNLPGLEQLTDRIALTIEDVRAVGSDWRFIAKVQSHR
ncbi:MAG: bifunctional diaminohydroxyphosphoribosylaminopyrimidine deaminase/5-amino-6-(5-phosphoribosylamino)uracil reductase RibD [Acidiferrobacterales bacterium]